MNPLYFLVAERAYHRCEYCRAPESIFNAVLEVEHINPVVAGGTSTEENLALACRSCNGFKGSRSNYVDPESGQEERLYHPRQDRWEEHFLVSSESCEIVGLTAIGRVTALCLKMNSRSQLIPQSYRQIPHNREGLSDILSTNIA
jgi:HNH endonuclease